MRQYTTVTKKGEVVNEDAVIWRDSLIAVSDGAGGGGVFAEKWSQYLVENLPKEPIDSFERLDAWVDSIWERFYEACEMLAKQQGGMLLDKFYDEGSFATLVAVWRTSPERCRWMSYGDSVAFHYNRSTGKLEHSYGRLEDFNNPPYLVNCKDPLSENGFHTGEFSTAPDSLVFVTSDALAHYIIMMYEVSHGDEFSAEIGSALNRKTKNSDYIKAAMAMKRNDFNTVIERLFNCQGNAVNLRRHLYALAKRGLIAVDDYSIAFL